MFNLTVTKRDRKWLRSSFRRLDIIYDDPTRIEGILDFDMYYDAERDECILNPSKEHWIDPRRIKDAYEIEITFSHSRFSALPQVRETGERIRIVAQERGDKLEDLHINKYLNDTACLCMQMEEKELFPEGFSLNVFVQQLVVPFFYWQSYLERQGCSPWDGYSHKVEGVLEWYEDNKTKVSSESLGKCIDLLRELEKGPRTVELLLSDTPPIVASMDLIPLFRYKAYKGFWQMREALRKHGMQANPTLELTQRLMIRASHRYLGKKPVLILNTRIRFKVGIKHI